MLIFSPRVTAWEKCAGTSVRDQDSYVYGPPGPESVIYLYAYGSGFFFYQQAKIFRKTLNPTVLWLLYDFLSLKNDINWINVSSKTKRGKHKNLEDTDLWLLYDFLSLKNDINWINVSSKTNRGKLKNLEDTDEKSRIRSRIRIRIW
jgi:hypothetical protein